MTRKLYEFETDSSNAKITANSDPTLGGKQVNVKSWILGGNLLANIFYQLIYDRNTIPKSTI